MQLGFRPCCSVQVLHVGHTADRRSWASLRGLQGPVYTLLLQHCTSCCYRNGQNVYLWGGAQPGLIEQVWHWWNVLTVALLAPQVLMMCSDLGTGGSPLVGNCPRLIPALWWYLFSFLSLPELVTKSLPCFGCHSSSHFFLLVQGPEADLLAGNLLWACWAPPKPNLTSIWGSLKSKSMLWLLLLNLLQRWLVS